MGSLARRIGKAVSAMTVHPNIRVVGGGAGFVRVVYTNGGVKPGRYRPAELQLACPPQIRFVIVEEKPR